MERRAAQRRAVCGRTRLAAGQRVVGVGCELATVASEETTARTKANSERKTAEAARRAGSRRRRRTTGAAKGGYMRGRGRRGWVRWTVAASMSRASADTGSCWSTLISCPPYRASRPISPPDRAHPRLVPSPRRFSRRAAATLPLLPPIDPVCAPTPAPSAGRRPPRARLLSDTRHSGDDHRSISTHPAAPCARISNCSTLRTLQG